MNIKKRIYSFRNAFRGIIQIYMNEINFRIHICLMIIVILLGFLLGISKEDWIVIIICIGIVLAIESLNSAIEYLCDVIEPEYNPTIKKVKDAAAGAVLIVAISALIIGMIIFIPKIENLGLLTMIKTKNFIVLL